MLSEQELPSNRKPFWQRKVSNLALALTLIASIGSSVQPIQGLHLILSGSVKLGTFASAAIIVFALVTLLLSFFGSLFIVIGLWKSISWHCRPEGKIFDLLIPPDDAEYRALEMEIAFDRWTERHSRQKAWILYSVHTVSTVALYYVDRIKRGK